LSRCCVVVSILWQQLYAVLGLIIKII
jgi:hypothetical protein